MTTGKEIVEAIISVPKVIESLYGDLAQPGVKKVGMALSTVIGLSNTILLPIKLLNEKANLNFKKHMDNYKKKIEDIDDKKILDVPPEIGMPIIDKLTYVTNEEIADLFTTLLSKASSIDTINQAHPSFVGFISRLSVDEANLIKYLKGKRDIPCVSLRAYRKGSKGFQTIVKDFTDIALNIKLTFPQNVGLYIDNFVSMGILSKAEGLHKIDDKYYKAVTDQLTKTKEQIDSSDIFEKTEYSKSYFEVTTFGQQFINACSFSNKKTPHNIRS